MQLAGAVEQGHPWKMWPAVPGQGAPSFGRPQGDRVTSRVAARVTFRGLAMAGGGQGHLKMLAGGPVAGSPRGL